MKFTIGDTVTQIMRRSGEGRNTSVPELYGVIGTVVTFHQDLIGVDFGEKYQFDTHNLMGRLPKRTGRWYYEDDLQIVSVKQPKFIEDENYKNLFE